METNIKMEERNGTIRPQGITIVALLMIIFGIAEIATGFSHNFFGISTSISTIFTFSGIALGSFYAIAGLLILSMKRWAAAMAIVLLCADIVGRISLVATNLYPLNSTENVIGIVAGTAIATIFAIYIGMKWTLFR